MHLRMLSPTVVLLAFLVGCASPPQPIGLGYEAAPDVSSTDFKHFSVAMAAFEDARTTQFLYKDRLVLEPGADAGMWVANAIRTELEHSGAIINPDGSGDVGGYRLSGVVNVVQARQTGWSPGGLLGAMTAGLRSNIEVSLELLYQGVPRLHEVYQIDHEFKTDAGANFFFGANPAKEVPQALPLALQELIRTQILPDIKEATQENVAKASSQ